MQGSPKRIGPALRNVNSVLTPVGFQNSLTSGVLGRGAVRGDGLSVRLHGKLLEVGGEAVEVLVESITINVSQVHVYHGDCDLRGNQVSLGLEKVRVPDTEQTTEDGDVLAERSLLEVLVHGVGATEELVEVVVANVERNAQTDGAPDGVSATDPALEAKHVLAVDTKLGNLLLVGGEGNKVLGNLALVVGLLEEPRLGRVGVGRRLSGSEGLGGDEEKGGLGVGGLESLGHVGAVDVGHEMEGHVVSAVVLESFRNHDGATWK